MTSRDFVYWFQGYMEIASAGDESGPITLTSAQVACVKKHLALVFVHEIDPSAGPPEHQAKLDEAHSSPPKKPTGSGGGGSGTGMPPVYRC